MRVIQPFLWLGLFLVFLAPAYAQTEVILDVRKVDQNPDVEKLKAQKDKVEETEKKLLKNKVQNINKALEAGEITAQEADLQKKAAAEKHAKNIEDQFKIIDANIDLITRNLEENDDKAYYQHMSYLNKGSAVDTVNRRVKKYYKTYGDLVMNMGFSNTIGSGKSIGDDFSVGGSRFFDIGYEWSTGLTKNNFLRFRYGFNFQFNGFKAVDNQFLVKGENKEAHLEEFGTKLKKSKFRMDNLVIPLYLELGPASKTGYADKLKIGLGGYAGLNLKSIQKLKFKENGHRVKSKDYFNSQTEDLVYGLAAYIGYDSYAFFVKYDMNPMFKHNATSEQVIAAGLRIMW